jgi:hypothetical protein
LAPIAIRLGMDYPFDLVRQHARCTPMWCGWRAYDLAELDRCSVRLGTVSGEKFRRQNRPSRLSPYRVSSAERAASSLAEKTLDLSGDIA